MARHNTKKSKKSVGKTSKRKTPRHGKRRVSGIGAIPGQLEMAGAIILGAVAARELNTIITKQFPSFSPMMSGIVQAGVGFLLPMVVKNDFVDNMGLGMIANGGMVATVATGLISGVDEKMNFQLRPVNGFKMVAGAPNTGRNGFAVTAGINGTKPVRRSSRHVY